MSWSEHLSLHVDNNPLYPGISDSLRIAARQTLLSTECPDTLIDDPGGILTSLVSYIYQQTKLALGEWGENILGKSSINALQSLH